MDPRDQPGEPDFEAEFELDDATARELLPGRWGARTPLFAPRLTTRGRTRRAAAMVMIVFLALLLVLAGSPGLRAGAATLAASWLPTPVPTLAPGDDRFYLVPNVPWGAILLDGKPLAHIPLVGDGHPLQLARGRHQFEWRATPFMPLRCQITVPDDHRNMCWLGEDATRLFLARAPDDASVIPAHDDLSALPVAQRAALLVATQIALAQSVSQTILQPGERYAYLPGLGSLDRTNVAAQALRATLTFHPFSDLGVREPCAIGDPRIQPCRFPAQDCSQFCTLPTAALAGPRDTGSPLWLASTFVWVSWDYDTLDGKVVVHNQGDPGVNFRLIDLGITWDGTTWYVTPLFGHQTNIPSLDDTICSAARIWLARGPLAPLLPDGDATTALSYRSSTTPANGCTVVVAPRTAPGSLVGPGDVGALFFVRCGVLIAVNSQAHALWPELPVADGLERGLAEQLAARPPTS